MLYMAPKQHYHLQPIKPPLERTTSNCADAPHHVMHGILFSNQCPILAQCHSCLLYRHVRWMCPHWICTNCGRACRKSPFQCKRESQRRAKEIISSRSRNTNPPIYNMTPMTIQPSITSQTTVQLWNRWNSIHQNLPPDMHPGRILPYPRMTTQPHQGPPWPRCPCLPPPPSPPYEESYSDHNDLYRNSKQWMFVNNDWHFS